MKPLVSIITPSFNQGKFIRETIESVLSQDYESIEYIIIDGGSTDDSLEIIKEYSKFITYISESDRGQSDAINKGFRMAHGEIVAWLNSDDVYEPHCVSRAVEEFEKNDTLGLLYGKGYIIDAEGRKVRVFEHTQEFDYWKLVNYEDYIMQPATFFRLKYLKQIGYLDIDLHYCMDWDLWIRLAAVSEVKYTPYLLACSREYDETKTSTGGKERFKEICNLLCKYSGKEKPLGVRIYKISTKYSNNNIGLIKKKAWGVYLFILEFITKHKVPQLNDGYIGRTYQFCVPSKKNICKLELSIKHVLPIKLKVYVNEHHYCNREYKQETYDEILIKLSDFKNENHGVCSIYLKCESPSIKKIIKKKLIETKIFIGD